MPSLYGAGISLHLATQPLAASLTEKIELKRGYTAASKSENAEKALMESVHTLLPEERVSFPGDESNFALHWLGGVPFLQAAMGKPSDRSQQLANLKQRLALNNSCPMTEVNRRSSQGISTRSGRTLASDDVDTEKNKPVKLLPAHGLPIGRSPSGSMSNGLQEPKALVLHVMLTDKTFFHNPFDNSPQHLKIEVLFNGQLSNCVLLHTRDIQTGAKSFNQVFAGARVDYLAERPWVIHVSRPDDVPGFSLEESKVTGFQDRWIEICKALMTEANERGIDGNGERPPTAVYLQELASMQMPNSVSDMQRPGGMKFGVIDVIVTVGSGRKITNGAEYLKTPTRLPDERYGYQVNEGSDFELIRAVASAIRPAAIATDGQDAEGDSDPEFAVLPQTSLHGGLPALPGQALPLGPLHPTVNWHDPFTSTPIPSLPSIETSTSFIRQSLSHTEEREPPQKRGRLEIAALINRNDTNIEASRQIPPPRRPYPSAHGPSLPMSSSYAMSMPRTEFNVNQYDSFEHANPYQPPYTGIISALDFGSFDGPASSPLRNTSGGRLTLPSILPTPEEVIPSTVGASAFSSPYSQHSTLPSQESGYSSYNPTVPRTGLGIFGTGGFPQSSVTSDYPLQGPTGSNFPPTGTVSLQFGPAASVPYMPVHRSSSSGPPPPLGFFKVTEKPRTDVPTAPKLLSRKPSTSSIVLHRVVIRLGGRVVRSHYFTKPRKLPASPFLASDIAVTHDVSSKSRKESPGSAEWVERPVVRCRSNRTPSALATPPGTSPNVPINLATTEGPDKAKRDSIHDSFVSSGVTKTTEAAPTPTISRRNDASSTKTLIPTKPSPDTYVYTIMHRTSHTGILGVQGPKANAFVFDNPEELLRKRKSKAKAQSHSTSPIKVDAAPSEVNAGPIQATESRKVGQPVTFKIAGTRSSSPLSELSHSPELSFTMDTPTETTEPATVLVQTSKDCKIDPPTPPAPAVPAGPAATDSTILELRSSACVSRAAVTLPALRGPSMIPQNLPDQGSASAPSKRKHVPDEVVKLSSTGVYVKPPRSPNRLDVKDNPPLNRGCVIQYAVSEREGGALRQIKSERKGVFKEESVVVGCRFFVSGC